MRSKSEAGRDEKRSYGDRIGDGQTYSSSGLQVSKDLFQFCPSLHRNVQIHIIVAFIDLVVQPQSSEYDGR